MPSFFGTSRSSDARGEFELRKYLLFFEGEELLFSDAVLSWVQPLWASEHRGGTTCVDVVDDAM